MPKRWGAVAVGYVCGCVLRCSCNAPQVPVSDGEPPEPATVFVKLQFLIMKGIGEGVSRVCLARHLTYTKDPVRSGDLVMTTGVPSAPVWGGGGGVRRDGDSLYLLFRWGQALNGSRRCAMN